MVVGTDKELSEVTALYATVVMSLLESGNCGVVGFGSNSVDLVKNTSREVGIWVVVVLPAVEVVVVGAWEVVGSVEVVVTVDNVVVSLDVEVVLSGVEVASVVLTVTGVVAVVVAVVISGISGSAGLATVIVLNVVRGDSVSDCLAATVVWVVGLLDGVPPGVVVRIVVLADVVVKESLIAFCMPSFALPP